MRSLSTWIWRIGAIVGVFWLIGVAFLAPPSIPSSTDDPKLSLRLRRAVHELDLLKKQNDDIKGFLKDFTNQVKDMSDSQGDNNMLDKFQASGVVAELKAKLDHAQRMLQQVDSTGDRHDVPDFIPSSEYESTRRLVDRDIQETFWFINAELLNLKRSLADVPGASNSIDTIVEEFNDRVRVAKVDLEKLSGLDGLALWREREAAELSDLIQKRLHALQNPSDCSHAKKLVCNINKGCGYGCQVHHIVYCFIVAYGTQRTLILKSKGWRYHKNGWEDIFQPLSKTCTDPNGSSHSHWPSSAKTQVIDVPIVDTMLQRPPYLPLAIPEDLSERLIRLHGNPASWWIGQFLKYVLRPQEGTKEMLDNMAKEFNFQKPIVGIHIRRTDKVGTEAAFHSIEEYMSHVEEYYKKEELTKDNVVRRVYIATDDPTVIAEARRKFPGYIILGDPDIAKTASVSTRYSDNSLKGIIADIHFLSLSDYLVCTFSSQVCRIAYEIMQSFDPNAAYSFRSLDDIYYYGGQNAHQQKARFSHTARRPDEIDLQKGDTLGIAGNHWDGFSKGINRRTKRSGLYPSFKVEEIVDVAPVPPYKDIDYSNNS